MTLDDLTVGECFADALLLALALDNGRVSDLPEDFHEGNLGMREDSIRVCHGFPRWKSDPTKRMGHAWVEFQDNAMGVAWVLDTNGSKINGEWFAIPRGIYLRVGEIEEEFTHRYTPHEAAVHAAKESHHGPWEAQHPDQAMFKEGMQ
jgi:hypothetical protein